MNAKVTFPLKYGSAGTSFTLYSVVADLDVLTRIAPGGLSRVDTLARLWMQLLGTGVQMANIRISDEAVSGDSLFFPKSYITIGSGTVPPSGINTINVKSIINDVPDFYDTSALISLSSTNSAKGHIFMRFIPDSIVEFPVGLNPPANWDIAFDQMIRTLVTDSWSIRSLASPIVNAWKTVTKVTRLVAGGDMLVSTLEPHGMNIGDLVRISGIKNFANGIYTVGGFGPVAANDFYLLDTPGAALNPGQKGRARKQAPTWPNITRGAYKRATRRKAGRPFDAPVGHR